MNYWRLVTAGLQHRWIRTLLTTVGIIIAVAAVFILFSTIDGMKTTVLNELSKIGSNKIIIAPGSIGSMSLSNTYFTDSDIKLVERIPGIKTVLGIASSSATAEYSGKKVNILLRGVDPGKFEKIYEAMGAHIKEGRTLRAGDKYAALIGYTVADKAFGKSIHAGTSIRIGNKRFKVVGVLKKTGGPMDAAVYIPMDTYEEITGKKGRYNRIVALTAGTADISQVAERVKRVLKAHRGKEDFHILTPERMQSTANQILSMIEALLVSIAAIALVVGAVGIMNTMYMSVTERTREIGVMKAVGATRGQIMSIFLAEAGLLGLIGGVIGVLLGVIGTAAVEHVLRVLYLDTYHANYDVTVILALTAFSFVMGVVSGYLPAKEGADKDPIEAIRQ